VNCIVVLCWSLCLMSWSSLGCLSFKTWICTLDGSTVQKYSNYKTGTFNEELHLCSSTSVTRFITLMRTGWAVHVAHMGARIYISFFRWSSSECITWRQRYECKDKC
jgi:hypothetical protein